MAGIKRKGSQANKQHDDSVIKKSATSTASSKKRKLTSRPINPAAKVLSHVKSDTSEASDSDGGVNVSSSDEEAAIFGPNAQERGEAEWDSDPIVESDTTEHSGDDNGVSWPSDEDEAISTPPVIVKATGTTNRDREAGKAEQEKIPAEASSATGHDAGMRVLPSCRGTN